MRKLAVIVTICSVLAGIAGFFLRRAELLYVFDRATGLPEHGAAISTGLITLSFSFLITIIIISFFIVRYKIPEDNFSNIFNTSSDKYPVIFVIIAIIWAGGTLVNQFILIRAEALRIIDICFASLSLLSAAAIAGFAVEMYHKSRGKILYVLSLIPVVFMCFWLIVFYEYNAANPILLSYAYVCLAIISAAMSFYFTAGFVFKKYSPAKAIVSYSSTIFFCLTAIADSPDFSISIIYIAIAFSAAYYLLMLLWNLKDRKDIEQIETVDELYKLYRKTLPDIVRDEDTVRKILLNKKTKILDYKDDRDLHLVGFSVLYENAIYLLCVNPDNQNLGIGTYLLKESEKEISRNGYDSIILGAGKDYIMPGVPMNNNAHEFFVKNKYLHSWGDCSCVDMSLELAGFYYDKHQIGDTVKYITYRWADINDYSNIYECVVSSEDNFAKFYEGKEFYDDDSKTKILVATRKQRVVGVLMVIDSNTDDGIGYLAALTTAPDMRGKGIATMLMNLGTKALKDMGLRLSYLSYTYTDIIGLYKNVGYEVCMEYFMGEKKLNQKTEFSEHEYEMSF